MLSEHDSDFSIIDGHWQRASADAGDKRCHKQRKAATAHVTERLRVMAQCKLLFMQHRQDDPDCSLQMRRVINLCPNQVLYDWTADLPATSGRDKTIGFIVVPQ